MIFRLIILVLLCSISAIIVDVNSIFILIIPYVLGSILIFSLNKGDSIKRNAIYLFQAVFLIYSAYSLLCYGYMTYHNYIYLIEPDTITAFVPRTELFISFGNIGDSYRAIWDNYDFFGNNRLEGYFSYSVIWGFLSKLLETNLYFTLQISSVFISSFTAVVVFRLLIINKFTIEKSVKYSLIISLFTVFIIYGTIALRDIHVAFLYLLAIYLTFKGKFSAGNLLKLLTVIFVCCTFRIESGLFLFVLVPIYLLLSLNNRKHKKHVLFVSLALGITFLFLTITNYNTIYSVFYNNQEHYTEDVVLGSGVISTLQKVPIAGDLASIAYNAIQPLPFWSILSTPKNSTRVEAYNIMAFPLSISSFFHFFILAYILFWIFSKELRKKTKGFISKPLKYQLWIGLVFLYMQSAVIAQRRLIAYYCIFYILFFIIFNHIGEKEKKQITLTAIFSFIALQIIGVIYLS